MSIPNESSSHTHNNDYVNQKNQGLNVLVKVLRVTRLHNGNLRAGSVRVGDWQIIKRIRKEPGKRAFVHFPVSRQRGGYLLYCAAAQ